MDSFRSRSTSEQLADFLRRQIENGSLRGALPGVQHLVKTLGVNSVAVGKAVRQLESEGLVLYQGDRKSRLIADAALSKSGALKVGMLYYDSMNASRHDALCINRELSNAGHAVMVAPKSMIEMGMDAQRTARLVQSMEADAWVIFAGSRQILEWFEGQELPAFALHGRQNQVALPSIGINKSPVISDLTRKLVDYGHRRIVMLTREERRKPHYGALEQHFLDELEANGIQTGSYNIPDWKDSPEGLEKVIDSLFEFTPPTALIVGDPQTLHAVQVHLARKGIVAPNDLSLFCNDYEQSFSWARPEIAHIQWDERPSIRRVTQWANNISKGKKDTKKSHIKAVLYEGGTLGPAPSKS